MNSILPSSVTSSLANKCPSCGKTMSIDFEITRDDYRYRTKVVERVLSCNLCRIRIRQYIYLW
ncbi:MAG: hypothetical protein B6V02_00820 [Thermoprotei archaeon ex4572_64]|nr:MAG: hypothetical protein B6V02_00820 [Thermoprotei archaeon ex4572_64]